MNSKNSYICVNPLVDTFEKSLDKPKNALYSKIAYTSSQLLPKIPKTLLKKKPTLEYNESQFNTLYPYKPIYELQYYNQKYHKSLPRYGWIKPCVYCNNITSVTIIYSHPYYTDYKHFRIYICPECKNTHSNILLSDCKHSVTKHMVIGTYHIVPNFQ